MLNALSIDVEEWYHPELVRPYVSDAEKNTQARAATRRLLELLRRYDARATFFLVGEVAARSPQLWSDIREGGHEVACHGLSHRPLHALGPEGFRSELTAWAQIAADAGVREVAGFRAPTFSLDNTTRWAVKILADFGYIYDSSVFPMRNYLYGVRDCPPFPYRLGTEEVTRDDPQGLLWEFPLSVWRWGVWRFPVCGGFYLRAIPIAALRALLRGINRRGWPFVIYLHPWETYPETPRRRELSWLSRWVTYVGLEKTLGKLERLLRDFSFAPLRDVLEGWKRSSLGSPHEEGNRRR